MNRAKRVLTDQEVSQVETLWGQGVNASLICLEIGISVDILKQRRKPGGQLQHLEKRPRGSGHKSHKNYTPDQETIKRECKKFQDSWDTNEEILRRNGHAANPLVKEHRGTPERYGRNHEPIKLGMLRGRDYK